MPRADRAEGARDSDISAQLQSVLDGALDAVVIMDAQGLIVSWAGQAESIFGWTSAEAVGAMLADRIIPPEHREAHRRGLDRFLTTGVGPILRRRIEITGCHRDGHPFPIELTVSPIQSGTTWIFSAFIRDLSERTLRERRLTAQHAVTRLLAGAETVPDAIAEVLRCLCESLDWDVGELWQMDGATGVLRRTGSWHVLSPQLAQFARVSSDITFADGQGVPGRTWGTNAHVWVVDFSVEPIPRASLAGEAGLKSSFGYPVPDGSQALGVMQFWSRQTREPDLDLLAMMANVATQVGQFAQRHRAQEGIRRSQERFRFLMEQAADAIFLTDLNGRIVDANTAACTLSGYSREELLTMRTHETFPPDDRVVPSRLLAEIESGGSVLMERQFLRKDGSIIQVETNAKLLPDGLVQGIVRDIGHRKQLEERLRQAQKMEAVGQLAAGVAHDFNNLLTAINGYAQLVLDSLPKGAPLRLDIMEIHAAGARAATLTQQLLAFGRRQVLQTRVLDLNILVSNIHRLLVRVIGENIALMTDLQSGLGPVRADPGQIEQVILNLAVNARDAMPDGGRLTLATREVHLDPIESARWELIPGEYVMLTVTDTGTGMEQELQARIFEPFFTTKPQGYGTGLGLATVYGIVKQSGGAVGVMSTPDKGSTFTVYLPRAEDPVEPRRISGPVGRPPAAGLTVLLVEDEGAVRHLVRRVLLGHGYELLEAASGEEAVSLAAQRRGPIHLLLTDVVMPGMTGRELADRLLANHPLMRVLYMSGYPDDSVVRHGVQASDLEYIQKPFKPDALLHRIDELLHGGSTGISTP
jgi:PAS domain S-box-containing protein